MIIVNLLGGLGNQLFQYSLGWRLARDAGADLRLDMRALLDRTARARPLIPRDYSLDVFGIEPREPSAADLARFWLSHSDWRVRKIAGALRSRLPVRGHRVVIERSSEFHPELLRIKGDAYLDGYWQTEKYFSDRAGELRTHLRMRVPLNESAARLAAEIENCNAVCLHVRRTDFIGHPVHDVCDADYFRRGVEHIRHKHSDARCFVFSDDIEWCRDHLDLGVPLRFAAADAAGWKASNHLELMARCRHFVISNSSFGWWAAWLARNPTKSVVAPQTWLLDSRRDTRDIVPESWTRL